MGNQSLFKTGKPDPRLARIISIESPQSFKKSISRLKMDGITKKEKKALVLAKNRANAQLKRKNLSMKERKQFKEISKIKLPKISKKNKLKNFGYN